MKKIEWLGFAFFSSVLCALPADGAVVVKKPGEKVQLSCGLPRGDDMEWLHEQSRVILVRKSGIPAKGNGDLPRRVSVRQMTLEIPSVKEADAGMFTCKTNKRSEQHLLILITVSASPSTRLHRNGMATLKCQVKGPKSVPTVQWRKPDGSLHPGSEVALKSVAHSDQGAWNCTFSYDGTTYVQRLDIRVEEPPPEPGNPQGASEEPGCRDCGSGAGGTRTSPVPPPAPPLLLGLSWQLWVVIGVGCLVVVLLMVCAIYLCRRIQRKKRKLRMMETSRQLLMSKQYCRCNRPTASSKLQPRVRPSAPRLQPLHVQ